MDGRDLALVLLLSTIPLAACAGGAPSKENAASPLDAVAEAYVKLVLAIGRHDALYVDAYYGPPEWKAAAEAAAPVPLPDLLAEARSLVERARRAGGPADRARYLEKQLVAAEGHLRRLSGERMTLAEECRLLYDADPPRHDVAEFAAAHEALESLVPGEGPLGPRIEAMRKAAHVPPERLAGALTATLDLSRRASAPFVTLPGTERFETVLVRDKPWGAYNWYLGNYASRIELNTDLPTEANGLLGTMCHEGYPGHHLYNVLLEEKLVRGKGWIEYAIYPLYSPQSLLAEGSANVGIDVVFTDDQRRRALAEIVAPAAGLPAEALLANDRLREALEPLAYVHGEAARMLLDEGRPEAEVVAFLVRWGLMTEARAKQNVEFLKTYRSYVFNYSLGEDIVREWIGTGPDRAERFFDILSRPVVPSDLRR